MNTSNIRLREPACLECFQSRRRFLSVGLLAAASAVMEAELLFPCRVLAAADDNPGFLCVSLASRTELQTVFGSVMIEVNGAIPAVSPVVLTRTSDSTFACVTSVCTHAGCTIYPYSTANQSINCLCHGSRFAATGEVLRGPAALPLQSYPTQFDGQDTVTIRIPGLGFKVTGSSVSAGGATRFRLEIPTQSGRTYTVQFRATISSPPASVLHSKTKEGAMEFSTITGTGSPVAVFLEITAGSGFFSVSAN